MQLTADGIKGAHERLGTPGEILRQRRVLYTAAVELCAEGDDAVNLTDDVLDNPAVRWHLGAVLGGRMRYSPDHLRPLAEVVAAGFAAEVEGHPVRLASAPSARVDLAGALCRVSDELERHGDENLGLTLLTAGGPGDLVRTYDLLVEGVRLAARVAPELALDLLPHVGLFAVIDAHDSVRLGSASAREYPGLILIPSPRTALEVAEALIHEGAHQKFFDFGMTRTILGAQSPRAPRFRPSWAPSGAHPWPLEQSIAAWHAYSCLAAFAIGLADSGENDPVHADSLLPKSPARAAEIGQWLRRQGAFLGPDAHDLIAALEGDPPHDPWASEESDKDLMAIDDGKILVRPCGSRTLVARRGSPPQLYWVNADLARGGAISRG
jgi:hypothetical protein